MEFAAIAEFLRAVHINGKPLDLPEEISQIHTHPRLTLNLVKTIDTPHLERAAALHDVAEASATANSQITDRLSQLDRRLEALIEALEKKNTP